MKKVKKQIKFSKGQIVPELLERTDLELYNSSAQLMNNVVSTIYGGARSRRGTDLIDRCYFGTERSTGTATTGLDGNISDLQTDGKTFNTATTVGTRKEFFKIVYDEVKAFGTVAIDGINFIFREPKVSCDRYPVNSNDWGIRNPVIEDAGEGIHENDYFKNRPGARWSTVPVIEHTTGGAENKITSVNITNPGNIYNHNFGLPDPFLTFFKTSEWACKCELRVSSDGVSFHKIADFSINETKQSFNFEIKEPFKAISVVRVGDDNIKARLSIETTKAFTAQAGKEKGKMIDFIYNNDQRYLLILSDQYITIYQNDVLIKVLDAVGLKGEYLDLLKWAYKEDTIIFVHQEMHPKILKRLDTGDWSFGDLDLKNIPFATFDGEKSEAKTNKITPSGTEGAIKITADADIFTEADVGQFIDGNGGRLRISSYTSARVVNGYTVIPFYTTDAITSWDKISGYEPVWSEKRGYPRTCGFAQQRLWFGGSKGKPTGIWGSRLGDYFNFKNSGNYDNDSIDITLPTADPTVNLLANRGLHIFTAGQELTVPENSFTPNTFTVVQNTNNGSLANVSPKILGSGVVVFVERNGKSLLSYVYDYNQSSYTTENLSLFSRLLKAPVDLDVDRNSSVDKGDFLYLVLEDGTMLVNCLSLTQGINSCTVFETDGKILDVCCLREEVYLLVDRGDAVYLEKISDANTDLTIKKSCYSATLENLNDFEKKYVYVYDENKIYGKHFVLDGKITLDEVPNKTCFVGLPFSYEIESNPIAINNLTTSAKKRIAKAVVTCENTNRLNFNGQIKESKDVYEFFACTRFEKDVRFKIKGEFDKMEILSVYLELNCEG